MITTPSFAAAASLPPSVDGDWEGRLEDWGSGSDVLQIFLGYISGIISTTPQPKNQSATSLPPCSH